MVVERALDELRIEGEFDEQKANEYPAIVTLMRDVLDHGKFTRSGRAPTTK